MELPRIWLDLSSCLQGSSIGGLEGAHMVTHVMIAPLHWLEMVAPRKIWDFSSAWSVHGLRLILSRHAFHYPHRVQSGKFQVDIVTKSRYDIYQTKWSRALERMAQLCYWTGVHLARKRGGIRIHPFGVSAKAPQKSLCWTGLSLVPWMSSNQVHSCWLPSYPFGYKLIAWLHVTEQCCCSL